MTPRLGVNIDHVATVRQARGGREPDPVWAAVEAELGGADGITVHLREDRRHVQDRDVRVLRGTVRTRLNLEAAVAPEMVDFALEIRPDQVTFVPERRQEVTTEGGLDVVGQRPRVADAVQRCRAAGLSVSLFIDPTLAQVLAAAELGVDAVELHTGRYADATTRGERDDELAALVDAGRAAREAGMALHAGHGLTLHNLGDVARIAGMAELNVGHSLVSRAVFLGMREAVREMKACLMVIGGRADH